MYSNTVQSGFSHARFYVFNRTNLYAGGTASSSLSLTNFGGTIVPATTYDTNQSTLHFLQMWNPAFASGGVTNGYLRVYTLTGTPTSPTFNITSIFPQTDPWAFWPGDIDFAPQTNTSVKIRTGDSRMQNVVYRNGSLWCTHNIFLPVVSPTRSSVQWWQMSTNGNVQQAGRIDDSAGVKFYAFPSIAVNRFNDALVGNFSSSISLSGSQGSTNGTNIRATKESGEPNHAGNSGGASVWYHWTAPASGSVANTAPFTLTDTAFTNNPQRFYRAIYKP